MSKHTKGMIGMNMQKNIPYRHCFTEAGMIETEQATFSVMYRLEQPEKIASGFHNPKIIRILMENVLKKLSDTFSFQIEVRKTLIDKEEALEPFLMDEKLTDEFSAVRSLYNQVIRENSEIGHNNSKREEYLILVYKSENKDEALENFEKADVWIKALFQELYEYNAVRMTLEERMQLMFGIYHPGEEESFGSVLGMDAETFSIQRMKELKYTTKDIIAPTVYDYSNRDYLKLQNRYVRSFFINSLPAVSSNVLNDLLSISGNAVLSIGYEPIDCDLGYEIASDAVRKNTEVRMVPVRDTIEDRRNHRVVRQEKRIVESEDAYFNEKALELFKLAKSRDQKAVQSCIVISLSADSLEELEKDTELLMMAASKYVCRIKCADYQQNEAFQTILPLGNPKLNINRVFSLEDMALMQPLDIYSIFNKHPTYLGLSNINDSMIFMDKSSCPISMIAGEEKSGKTVEVKREVVNTLISSRDDVFILTNKPKEYEDFCINLRGRIIYGFEPDLFMRDENYNLNEEKRQLLKTFFEAYLTVKTESYKQRLTGVQLQQMTKQIEEEARKLCTFENLDQALLYAKEHPVEMQLFVKCLEEFHFASDELNGGKRLTVMNFENSTELLVRLDYLHNHAITSKKQNRNVCIYVDTVDLLLQSTATSDYLISIMDRAEKLRIQVTLVVGNAAKIVANSRTVIDFDFLLKRIQYYKLLSMGPIERKKFVDTLNISTQLIPYFSNRSPGEGILVTPTGNLPFNDYLKGENDFYKLFR